MSGNGERGQILIHAHKLCHSQQCGACHALQRQLRFFELRNSSLLQTACQGVCQGVGYSGPQVLPEQRVDSLPRCASGVTNEFVRAQCNICSGKTFGCGHNGTGTRQMVRSERTQLDTAGSQFRRKSPNACGHLEIQNVQSPG